VFTPGLVACGTTAKSPEGATGFWATIATAARAGDPSLSAHSAIAELGPELGAVDRTQLDRPGPSVLEAFTKRSTDDFAAGRTVVVVGWLLSRTEVLLATVAAEVTR
jgi:hypothetical protein